MLRPLRLAVCLFSAMTGLAAAAPTVVLTPKSGPPNMPVKAAVSGFAAHATVNVVFDSFPACAVVTDGQGKGSCSFKVSPFAQPFGHWVTALNAVTNLGAQAKFSVRTDWPQFRGMTSYRTGANPYESAIFSNNVSTLDELWSKPIGAGGTFGSPVVAAGKVYVGSESKRLYAFDQLTGATVPGFPKVLPAGVQSTPVVTNNVVFVATKAPDNKLYGFNATTGKPVAGYPKSLQGPVLLPLTAAYGNVYALAAGINKLYGYKVAGGGTVTGFPKTLPVAVSQPPVIGYGSIFLTAADHQLYGYNATTGAALANLPFDYQASGAVAPIIAAGMVLVGDGASAVLGVDAHGPAFMGQVVNKTDVLRNFTGAALYSNGNIGVAVHTDVAKQLLPGISLYNAVNNLSTGSFVSPGEVNLSSPIVANGVYYVATGQWVHAFHTTQPQPVWSHHVSTGIFSTPVVSNGILHVASTDGKLYAFSPLGLPPGAASPKAPSLAKLAAAVRATRR